MLKIIENNSQKYPVFLVINSITGQLIKECLSRAEAEKVKDKIESEDII